jgi:hypothetical protein
MNVNKSSTTTASISWQQQHKRCVSFNPMVEVCYLESSSASPSIQEETIDSSELWWTARDYKQIKNRCVYAVRRKLYQCEMHDDSDDEIDCNIDFEYRGLERYMDDGNARALITNSVRAVTREQARQLLDGVFEENSADLYLARVYGARCTHSKMKAERLGFLDAREAMAALRSEWATPPVSPTRSSLESEQPSSSPSSSLPSSSLPSSLSVKEQTTENITDSSIAGRQWQPKSIHCHSSERVKFALTTVMTHQRRAWI